MKIDLGCGPKKKEGFIGVDIRQIPGVDVVGDLGKDVWPFADETVDEAFSSHFVEHLAAKERIHFVNELYRVLKKGAKATLITPHWNSCRAYGDLTHQWPPVCEAWFYYLNKDWRADNAPHNDGYTCDFTSTWGGSLNPALEVRSEEHRRFATENYKESVWDIIGTLTKR